MNPEHSSRRLTVTEAAAYVGCRSVKAFYSWRKRRFVPRAKVYRTADLDSLLKADARLRERKRRKMHPASLANLRRRRVDTVGEPTQWQAELDINWRRAVLAMNVLYEKYPRIAKLAARELRVLLEREAHLAVAVDSTPGVSA